MIQPERNGIDKIRPSPAIDNGIEEPLQGKSDTLYERRRRRGRDEEERGGGEGWRKRKERKSPERWEQG